MLGFPYILRGALDVQATRINEAMLIAAARAIAALAEEPVPADLLQRYEVEQLAFGRDYLLPRILDYRLKERVAVAVAQAAVDSGVARRQIDDWDHYRASLRP